MKAVADNSGNQDHVGISKMDFFRDVTSCILVDTDRRFGGVCCLHHQGPSFQEDDQLYTRKQTFETCFRFSFFYTQHVHATDLKGNFLHITVLTQFCLHSHLFFLSRVYGFRTGEIPPCTQPVIRTVEEVATGPPSLLVRKNFEANPTVA
jgi:hypothetical protein